MLSKLREFAVSRSTMLLALVAVAVAGVVLLATTTFDPDPGTPSAEPTPTRTNRLASPTATAPSTPPASQIPSSAPADTPAAPSDTAADAGQPPVEPTPPAAAPPVAAPPVAAVPPAQPPAPETTEAAPPADPPAPAGQSLPLYYDGGAGQVVTVVAPSWGSTTATVTAWNRNDDGSWSAAVGPVSARIGADGIGQASESVSRTPAGTYTLTQAFGTAGNPGTSLSYFQTGPQDWWDENPDSPTYNQHVVQSESPGGASENLFYAGGVYRYAINIDYNTGGIPGAGSAFFLHVSNGSATAGCVAIDQGSLVSILQWIGYGAVIVLGVG